MFLGNGSGGFKASAPISTTLALPLVETAADFNGDGRLDVTVIDYAGNSTINVLLSQFAQTTTTSASGIVVTGAHTHQVEAKYPGDTNFSSSVSSTIAFMSNPR